MPTSSDRGCRISSFSSKSVAVCTDRTNTIGRNSGLSSYNSFDNGAPARNFAGKFLPPLPRARLSVGLPLPRPIPPSSKVSANDVYCGLPRPRGVWKPRWGVEDPLCGDAKPLCGIVTPLCGVAKPLCGIEEPLWGVEYPLPRPCPRPRGVLNPLLLGPPLFASKPT